MPRFSISLGRRRSGPDPSLAPAGPSFRVLDRSELDNGRQFDGGSQLVAKTHRQFNTSVSSINSDDNIFADLKANPTNRGSGSSNTTKTISDDSSRHSNTSTVPSSADLGPRDGWRATPRNPPNRSSSSPSLQDKIPPVPPIPKSSPASFLKSAGRTFSFGAHRKNLHSIQSADEDCTSEACESMNQPPPTTAPAPLSAPHSSSPPKMTGRARAVTASTETTITPAHHEDDLDLDLGGDFSNMFAGSGYDKRASVLTLRNNQNGQPALAPRSLTGTRLNQPSPPPLDRSPKAELPRGSWTSESSNEHLLNPSSRTTSPVPVIETAPPPVPPHGIPLDVKTSQTHLRDTTGQTRSPNSSSGSVVVNSGEEEDEEARLLREELLGVSHFVSKSGVSPASSTNGRYRRDDEPRGPDSNLKLDDDSLFAASHGRGSERVKRKAPSAKMPGKNKVMTPAQFEQYLKDKAKYGNAYDTTSATSEKGEDEDADYDDDDDNQEKVKEQARQRRKQEAHMSVYRQQMMKVTGESANFSPSRPTLQISLSTPDLPNLSTTPSPEPSPSGQVDEDEEIPLAILAAHGFPNRNRPPTRLSTMMSNPNLRAAAQPSYQRPSSAVGESVGAGNGTQLPAFARNLPQDPFIGASLVCNSIRENFALGGGSQSSPSGLPGKASQLPPGGLVGVIASEERSRALRRGSPAVDNQRTMSLTGGGAFDPLGGMTQQNMYPNKPSPSILTPGDQAQIHMTQQMQQFMQMQMQFMQLMATQGGGGFNSSMRPTSGLVGSQSSGNLGAFDNGMAMPGMGGLPNLPGMANLDAARHSYADGGSNPMLNLPQPRADMRTMSMVQPSSASWIQPPQISNPGYAPSVHAQGAYAPSIAPSERSNIGLPGRYRPVSQMIPAQAPIRPSHLRTPSNLSGMHSLGLSEKRDSTVSPVKPANSDDDDDDEEQGWAAMKAKREKKKSSWTSRKTIGSGELSALIS